jgi:hypothetical protein
MNHRNISHKLILITAAFGLWPSGFVLTADDLPKGEIIITRFVEATGGKAAYQKIHNAVSTGTFEVPAQGIKGTMSIYQATPDKSYLTVDIAGIGKMEEGADGTVAWALSAMQGPRIKEGDEKAMALRSAGFNRELNWSKFYKTAETVGTEDVNGKTCYKVVETPLEGKPETTFYDKDSGLLVKMSTQLASPMGELPIETEILDYRKEGGILTPHRLKQSAGPMQILTTIDIVKFNIEVPKDRFDLPPEVKALVAKAK